MIAFLYYRLELLKLMGITKVESETTFNNIVVPTQTGAAKIEQDEDYLPKPAIDADITPIVQSFRDEVKAYLQETANRKAVKEQILYGLQSIALKYPALKDADCNTGMKHFVLEQAAAYLPGISLSDDIHHLWYPLK
jgi:hypothetical protein